MVVVTGLSIQGGYYRGPTQNNEKDANSDEIFLAMPDSRQTKQTIDESKNDGKNEEQPVVEPEEEGLNVERELYEVEAVLGKRVRKVCLLWHIFLFACIIFTPFSFYLYGSLENNNSIIAYTFDLGFQSVIWCCV